MEGFVTDPECVTQNRRRVLMFPFDIQCHLFNLIFLQCGKERMMNSIEDHYSRQYNTMPPTHTHTLQCDTHLLAKRLLQTDFLLRADRKGVGKQNTAFLNQKKKNNLFHAVPGYQQLVEKLLYEKCFCRLKFMQNFKKDCDLRWL